MSFKDNLKNQLEYSGMYVKELAARSGVKKQTIDGYLNVHEYTPSAENAVKIARALGVSVEYLVTGEEPAAGKPALPPHSAGLWLPLDAEEGTADPPAIDAQGIAEIRLISQIAAALPSRGRKLALAIVKNIKNQEI